ncbi:MAG: MCE family protein [candidate division Zixibacteria bacterium]|nr:MCE family protein [candidate division Zixibacteria bacterium]
MASRNNIEFRVGIVVLICLILLGTSIYWLQGYKLERNSQIVKVRFDDAGALAVGDQVTVSGILKGKVQKLELADNGVTVELRIWKEVVLKKDATFTIKNMGVMGERFVAVWPGRDTALLDKGLLIEGRYDTGLPDVMGLLGEMITQLRDMVNSLKRTVASDSSLAKFNATISNFEAVSASLQRSVVRNESKFTQTAENFLTASRRFNELIQRNASLVDTSATRLDRSMDRIERFTCQLDTMSVSARKFAKMLEQEDGTLPLLMQDRRLYDDLRRTASSLDELVKDIREHPKKYINIKVELF